MLKQDLEEQDAILYLALLFFHLILTVSLPKLKNSEVPVRTLHLVPKDRPPPLCGQWGSSMILMMVATELSPDGVSAL